MSAENIKDSVRDHSDEVFDPNDPNDRPDWANLRLNNISKDLENFDSKPPRSFDCSSLDVDIVGTEKKDSIVYFNIEISSGIKKWRVFRRYRDFYYMDKQLHKHFTKLELPELPPKTYLKSSSDPEVINQRKQLLDNYLKSLVKIQMIWTRDSLALFLNDHKNSMMFIWNYEKMRRLQDV